MGWYIDEARKDGVKLRPRARVLAEVLGFGEMPAITPGTFEAVMQLLEADVLMHTEYPALSDRIKHLGSMIESAASENG